MQVENFFSALSGAEPVAVWPRVAGDDDHLRKERLLFGSPPTLDGTKRPPLKHRRGVVDRGLPHVREDDLAHDRPVLQGVDDLQPYLELVRAGRPAAGTGCPARTAARPRPAAARRRLRQRRAPPAGWPSGTCRRRRATAWTPPPCAARPSWHSTSRR